MSDRDWYRSSYRIEEARKYLELQVAQLNGCIEGFGAAIHSSGRKRSEIVAGCISKIRTVGANLKHMERHFDQLDEDTP